MSYPQTASARSHRAEQLLTGAGADLVDDAGNLPADSHPPSCSPRSHDAGPTILLGAGMEVDS